jgi:hypothetical protein
MHLIEYPAIGVQFPLRSPGSRLNEARQQTDLLLSELQFPQREIGDIEEFVEPA